MKTGYEPKADFTEVSRWYELWRSISNEIVRFFEKILKTFGLYS